MLSIDESNLAGCYFHCSEQLVSGVMRLARSIKRVVKFLYLMAANEL